MDFANILSTAGTIAAVLAVASVLRQRDTISTLKENNAALQERVDILEHSHKENEHQISKLQGELNAYKELVLVPETLIEQLLEKDNQIIGMLEAK